MTERSSELPVGESERGATGHGRRVVLYGSSRSAHDALLAARGLLLAGLLGPAAFGVWTLFRLGCRYAATAELGIRNGLEFEVSRSVGAAETPSAVYGRSVVTFLTLVFGGLAALALVASFVVDDETAALVLRALAVGVLLERLWQYGMTYLRAEHSLRPFALMELGSAGLHFGLSIALAVVWGLRGALIGFVVATIVSILLLGPRVPLRPGWHGGAVRRLLQIGFPVSLTALATLLLSTVDRLAVASIGGTTMLGYYGLAVAVGGLADSFGLVVRTVVFPDVYGAVDDQGPAQAVSRLVRKAIVPYAVVLPLLLGFVAFLLGPAARWIAPQYLDAVAPARLFLFHGVAGGFASLGTLGLIAASKQWTLPALAAAAAVLNAALAVALLWAGLGLEAVAAEALLVRVLFGGSVVAAAVRWSGIDRPRRTVARMIVPVLYCASLVYALGQVFPGTGWDAVLKSWAVYALALLPLLPLVRSELRAAAA